VSTFTDDFSGTAGTLNGRTFSGGGATWAHTLGSAMAVDGSGNCVIPSGGSDNTSVAGTDLASDDIEAVLNLAGFTSNLSWYIWFGIGSNAGATRASEFGLAYDGAITLYAINSGAYDIIDTGTWTPGAAELKIKQISATGVVECYIDGVLAMSGVTGEPMGAGNRKAELGGYTNTGDILNYSNFVYRDVGGGGGSTQPPRSSHQFRMRRAA
jgi:hypothetical protein